MGRLVRYFAYGSNLNPKRMKERVLNALKHHPEHEDLRTVKRLLKNYDRYREAVDHTRKGATLIGYHLVFNKINEAIPGSGFANIMPHDPELIRKIRAGSLQGIPLPWVEGAIYTIPRGYFVILCITEGIYKKPPHYFLKEVTVDTGNKQVEATTLEASPKKIGQNLKPTRTYVQHILQGGDLLSDTYKRLLRRMATKKF